MEGLGVALGEHQTLLIAIRYRLARAHFFAEVGTAEVGVHSGRESASRTTLSLIDCVPSKNAAINALNRADHTVNGTFFQSQGRVILSGSISFRDSTSLFKATRVLSI